MATQSVTLKNKLTEYAELVKFEHTVFALPFALSAMLLALPNGQWPSVLSVICVLGAMIGGRTYAMALNRLLDAEIDGGNPRTAGRSIPAGRVSLKEAWGLTALAASLFIIAVLPLPPLCLTLLPIAFAILTLYSYVKRFSSLAHLVLGVALGSSAVGGWVAVTGELSTPAILFGLAVTFWVAGFDVIYACQDVDYDRSAKLNSMPANLGIEKALMLSRLFHGLAIFCLCLMGMVYSLLFPSVHYPDTLHWPYWLAVAITSGMLVYEHWLIRPRNTDEAIHLAKVNEAFFNINGKISLAVFVLILLNKLLA